MALTACLVIVPLLMAALVAAAGAFFMFKKSSAAQSLCVQQTVRAQEGLADTLDRLLAMNTQSKILRAQREAADRSLQTARASGFPYVIAAAQAHQLAVILMQLQHRARQLALLADAGAKRQASSRQLRAGLLALGAEHIRDIRFSQTLAVSPTPKNSLTPDYVRDQPFEQRQQERYRFQIDLNPRFVYWLKDSKTPQVHECSATIADGGGKKSQVRILAANPPSRR